MVTWSKIFSVVSRSYSLNVPAMVRGIPQELLHPPAILMDPASRRHWLNLFVHLYLPGLVLYAHFFLC